MSKKFDSAYDYAVWRLQRNPEASYSDVKVGCDKAGLEVWPIVYGRAKAALGMTGTPKKKTGEPKKKAPKKEPKKKASESAPKMWTTVATFESGNGSVNDLSQRLTQLMRDHERAITMLARIREILAGADGA